MRINVERAYALDVALRRTISVATRRERRYNPAVCFCRKRAKIRVARRVISPLKTKPIRTVLKWQVIATAVVAAIAGWWAGGHGAISAVLGGIVNLAAGVVYAFLLGLGLGAAPVPGAGDVARRDVPGGSGQDPRDRRRALARAVGCTGTSCRRRSSPRS